MKNFKINKIIIFLFICLFLIFTIYKFYKPINKFDSNLKISYKGIAVINTSVKCNKKVNEIKIKSILQKKINSKWKNVNEWNKIEKSNSAYIKITSEINKGYTYRVLSLVEIKTDKGINMYRNISMEKFY